MRIVIVDDHNLFREGLAAIICQEADIEVVGLGGTVQEAVEAVRQLKPDIVLMDFILPDGTGAEATRQIIQDNPNCKVVFMTMSDKDEDLLAAIRSGAVGYLMKNISPSKLVAALRSVQKGESALSRSMTLRLMKEFSQTEAPEPYLDPALGKLTPREKDVLAELATGKSNQEIAYQLFISENTIKYHVHSILDKLNLRDRKEAARFARQHGLIK
ncbi:MAG TPA: response regulator transcription factor [Anaerolineales bacterium]|nr:response regulator transcription factor [Anaerolineales bacterium]